MSVSGGVLEIDGAALAADFAALDAFGVEPGAPGVNRLAFGAADMAARAWVEAQMAALGMSVRRDAIGNTIGTLPGSEPGLAPIAIGSHTDSVPQGGRYDGALGVLAGLACVRAVVAAGLACRRPLEIINFVAEEATVGGGLLGSRAMVGALPERFGELPAWGEETVAQRLREAGIDPAGAPQARRQPGCLTAYLELHIEQGPVLERGEIPIGVVDSIVAIRTYRVGFDGEAGHAGTTPMVGRRDALVAAGHFITQVPEIAARHGIVATVGRATVAPGASNVIPSRVDLSLDARGPRETGLDAAQGELIACLQALGGTLASLTATAPVVLDPPLAQLVTGVARARGWRSLSLACGAGHDAMCMATLAPAALIFIPCRGGISHSPAEYADPAHCVQGAQVVLDAVRFLDQRANDQENP